MYFWMYFQLLRSEWKDSLSLDATVSGAHRKEPVEFFFRIFQVSGKRGVTRKLAGADDQV